MDKIATHKVRFLWMMMNFIEFPNSPVPSGAVALIHGSQRRQGRFYFAGIGNFEMSSISVHPPGSSILTREMHIEGSRDSTPFTGASLI